MDVGQVNPGYNLGWGRSQWRRIRVESGLEYGALVSGSYRRSTIFQCHLIFVGRRKKLMNIKNTKIYNAIQKSCTIMHFLDQYLEIKKLKHRNNYHE